MKPESNKGSLLTYTAGFLLSLCLTLVAYLLVRKHVNAHHLVFTDKFLLYATLSLAITQLFAQLIFFFHLDRESKPWWNNTALAFALIVVITIVAGSMWIMANLNYHHGAVNETHDGHILHTPQQTNQYIIQDEGVQPLSP